MLWRKALEAFENWKAHKTKQALLVTGARQVGKTFLIREFAKQNYENCVEINLFENIDAQEALSGTHDAEALFIRLAAFAKGELVPGKTLIFIDEVQEVSSIITSIKFLIDRFGNDYDFVMSGSLLGVELKNVRSMPVGYLEIIEMFPLDLEEFCRACNIPTLLIDQVRQAFDNRHPVDTTVHVRFSEAFYNYLIVGGMPDAVQAFVQDRNIQQVRHIQQDILDLYRYDISKYAGDRARVVRKIFDLIPSELNTQSKRFAIAHVEGESRFNRYENDFVWLMDAGVALAVCNVSEPRYPLELSLNSAYFKLFICDVGLLTCACGMDVVRSILNKRPDINYGSIYENYVAQEFAAHGFGSPSPERHLYFFRNRKEGELDFVIEHPRGKVLPIEVKSGKNYKRHSALSKVLQVDNYAIDHAIVLYEGNVEDKGDVAYLPMYMTMFLERS